MPLSSAQWSVLDADVHRQIGLDCHTVRSYSDEQCRPPTSDEHFDLRAKGQPHVAQSSLGFGSSRERDDACTRARWHAGERASDSVCRIHA
jgi:hypothetical protein